MVLKKNKIMVRIILVGGMLIALVQNAQAGALADAVIENKKILQAQMKDLPAVGDQLLNTGVMLNNQLLNELNKAETQIENQSNLLVIPQSIFNDPFGELAKQSPNDKFIQFMRKPEFRDLYNKLWSGILTPFGAASLPDVFNNLAQLLDLVQLKLTNIKSKFTPIVLDLSSYVNLKQAQKALPGTKKIDFNFVTNNRDYVESVYKKSTGGKEFDPKGIYSGLDGALKDFDKALTELNKLEQLFKALGL